MKRFILPLILSLVGTVAAETLVEPLDRAMVERKNHFGYTDAEIDSLFNRPFVLELNRDGLDRTYLKKPPAPGVHPRVLFNPEDIPDIRNRLENTETGRISMNAIRAHLDKQLRVPASPVAQMYDRLVEGRDIDTLTSNDVMHTAFVTVYEAFRALIDDDKEAGRRAAAAITSLATITKREVTANIEKEKAKPQPWMNFQNLAKGPSYQGTLGLMYDFAHQWMTPGQRDTVREAISVSHSGMTLIGAETLRSLHTNTSNWISWSSRMIFLAAAIEGEPGADPEAYKRVSDAMTGYIGTYFDSGEAYEGWGKNFMFFEHLAIMGKRGKDVLTAERLRNVFNTYFINAMYPWGGGFTFYDSQGGTGSPIARNADIVMYTFFFPQDAAGKFVFRNQVKDDPANIVPNNRVNTTHPFSVTDTLCVAIFANDYDSSKSWADDHAAIVKDRPLTLFSEDTGNVITRSSWDPNALYLNYLNRAVIGGHRYADRSHFSLYSHGRHWSIYRPMRQINSQRRPQNRSIVTLADDGPGYAPAKNVDFVDAPGATLIATDLRVPWDYGNNAPYTYNYYRLHPKDVPWMNMPLNRMPDWQTSLKPVPKPGEETVKPTRTPLVDHAYRTALLVRGSHPYALIVDDIQVSDEKRNYQWGMSLAPDVKVGEPSAVKDSGEGVVDVILGEADPKDTPRHLLVRILDSEAPPLADPPRKEEFVNDNPPQPDVVVPRLVIPNHAIAPRYKVLLYPHQEGDPLPRTIWNQERTQVTVEWPDQKDIITFSPHEDKRTRVQIVRNGKNLLAAE